MRLCLREVITNYLVPQTLDLKKITTTQQMSEGNETWSSSPFCSISADFSRNPGSQTENLNILFINIQVFVFSESAWEQRDKVEMYRITVLVKGVRGSLKWIQRLFIKKTQTVTASFACLGYKVAQRQNKLWWLFLNISLERILMFRDQWIERVGLVDTWIYYHLLFVIVLLLLFLNAFRQVMHFSVDCLIVLYVIVLIYLPL